MNFVLLKVILSLLQGSQVLKVHLFERTLIPKEHEVLHNFHLLAIAVLLAHVEYLAEVEGTGASNDATNIVALANVVEKEVPLYRSFHLSTLII